MRVFSHVVAAAAGGLVVAAVLTTLGDAEDTAAPPSSPERRAVAASPGRLPTARPPSPPVTDLAEAEARIAALERELDELTLQHRVVRGRLAAFEGEPAEWPDETPAFLRPDAFRAALTDVAAADPAWDLADVECDEYPCVAVLAHVGDGELRDAIDGLEARIVPVEHRDAAGVLVMARDVNGEQIVGVAITAEAGADDTRVRHRLEAAVEGAAEASPDRAAPTRRVAPDADAPDLARR